MNTYKFQQVLFLVFSLFSSSCVFADPGIELSQEPSCDKESADKLQSNLKKKADSVLQQLETLSISCSGDFYVFIPPYMSKGILEGDLKELFKEVFGRDVSIEDFDYGGNWGRIGSLSSFFMKCDSRSEIVKAFSLAIIDLCEEKNRIAFNAKIDEYLKICDQVLGYESEMVNGFSRLLHEMKHSSIIVDEIIENIEFINTTEKILGMFRNFRALEKLAIENHKSYVEGNKYSVKLVLGKLIKNLFGIISVKDFSVTDECGWNTRWNIINRKEYIEIFKAFLSAIIDECEEKSRNGVRAKVNEYADICKKYFAVGESEAINCFELLLRMMLTIIDSYDHRKETKVSTKKDDLFSQADLLIAKLDTEKKSENKVLDLEQNVRTLLNFLHSLYEDVEFDGGRTSVIQEAIEKESKIIFEETFGKDYSIKDFRPANQDGYIDVGTSREFMILVYIFLPAIVNGCKKNEVYTKFAKYLDICDLYFENSKEVDCLANLLWTCMRIFESFKIRGKSKLFFNPKFILEGLKA